MDLHALFVGKPNPVQTLAGRQPACSTIRNSQKNFGIAELSAPLRPQRINVLVTNSIFKNQIN
jgi:hypothetical protein